MPVLAAGTLGGVPYDTMPFVSGKSLRAVMTSDTRRFTGARQCCPAVLWHSVAAGQVRRQVRRATSACGR